MGWVSLIFISALSLLNLSLCLLFSGCLHLYLSFHRSVSVHLSLSVLSTEQQRFINVPAWFLAIPASSDLSLLEFIKKHSLSTAIYPGLYITATFFPFKPIRFNVCFSLCNLSFTLAKRKQQHKYHQPSCYHKYWKKTFSRLPLIIPSLLSSPSAFPCHLLLWLHFSASQCIEKNEALALLLYNVIYISQR